jgi:hypothetical protein
MSVTGMIIKKGRVKNETKNFIITNSDVTFEKKSPAFNMKHGVVPQHPAG